MRRFNCLSPVAVAATLAIALPLQAAAQRMPWDPPAEDYKPREWQKPHQPNLTGTGAAYRPKGSIIGQDRRPQVTGDYDAWTPGA